uniref:Uncharacterized protein n=1 Tax=Candidatus Kentrum sp. TUN TaxID=2126343 RepID=A0A450ZD16_9GAMM|nr:MAG: hypothetical protein BECKTUN1418E_GA0071001_100641 [Candidatus Kentron sp. TUN]VFK53637.1 MAG: hypothetical protein BECKTUN1418F_GA0071002_102616 [Candidatus Kentron sp. TUN]
MTFDKFIEFFSKENRALPVLAYPVNSIRQCALLPQRGYVYQPRVAAQQLPWVGKGYATNPERVASLFSQAPFTQPRWGWIFVPSLPRVAAAQQPWADIRSPFRAQKKRCRIHQVR